MKRRGYNHQSPIDYVEAREAYRNYPAVAVDLYQSYVDLLDRCEECGGNIDERLLQRSAS
jgi:hypothetical protein